MELYRAIKYIRLSYTDDRTVESDSVGNQRRMIDDFIAKHPEIEAFALRRCQCFRPGKGSRCGLRAARRARRHVSSLIPQT